VLFRHGLFRAGDLEALAPRPLMVVPNREPYIHSYDKQSITYASATGGVAVALDAPVSAETDAHGRVR
jgi:hypothetical protein